MQRVGKVLDNDRVIANFVNKAINNPGDAFKFTQLLIERIVAPVCTAGQQYDECECE